MFSRRTSKTRFQSRRLTVEPLVARLFLSADEAVKLTERYSDGGSDADADEAVKLTERYYHVLSTLRKKFGLNGQIVCSLSTSPEPM